MTESELGELHSGLDQIAEQIESGSFDWDTALEDVHMNIEQALTGITPVAGKLHTARSRNDQVATDMRLWFKDATASIVSELEAMIQQLSAESQSGRYSGYTYNELNRSGSAHLLYVTCFRDIERFTAGSERMNAL